MNRYTCCQRADEDMLRDEPDLFNCATCPVVAAQDDLYPENLDAWDVFGQLARRLVVDANLGAVVLQAATADRSPREVLELMDRLNVINDLVCPRREPNG